MDETLLYGDDMNVIIIVLNIMIRFNVSMNTHVFNICLISVDVCQVNPCLNGGKCISQKGTDYRCMCPDTFFGLNCQLQGIL